MASKKQLKQFHLFFPSEGYSGALDYSDSFVTLKDALKSTKGLVFCDDIQIMKTAKDGSLVDLCSIAGGGNSRFSRGTVYKYIAANDYRIWWAKKGKGEHWEERRRVPGPVLLGGSGEKPLQWEVRTEGDGEWQVKVN